MRYEYILFATYFDQSTNMAQVAPNDDYVGKIYGSCDGTIIKLNLVVAVIITRVTKKFVVARQLELQVLSIPQGNGYFNVENLGKTCIKKPLNMIGEEIKFRPNQLRYDDQRNLLNRFQQKVDTNVGTVSADYISRDNMILFLIDEDIVWSTLSPESSVWERVH